jgi:hypothetical protein
MRVQPRQQLLEIWRALAQWSFPNQAWTWGGRDGRNSVSDAEHLLCLLAPATQIPSFKLDQPNETPEDVLRALREIGDSVELPQRLVRVIADFMASYTDDSGAPLFGGGTYFDWVRSREDPDAKPTEQQRTQPVVDSFAMSVRLSLAVIGFLRVFRTVLSRDDLIREVTELEAAASKRLTAAIVGLLRSFAVNTFEIGSPAGEALLEMVNQAGAPTRRVVQDLQEALREINAGLRDLIGVGPAAELDNPNRLFECGWSWSITDDAPPVDTTDSIGNQPKGTAESAPYLYFTVIALDAIRDLFSQRTRVLNLLTEEQQRLARLLQVRWDLTQAYWATIARFGGGRWPLEDIPWRTTDEAESDYFTLLVASITVQALSTRPADAELARVARVLENLADRARITRRLTAVDPALALHAPGVEIALVGSDSLGGPRLSWTVSDFSPQLLKRVIRVASLVSATDLRAQVLHLADQIWGHLLARQHKTGAANRLWDQPNDVFQDLGRSPEQPSWYYTERVVECLIAAAGLVSSPPLRSTRLAEVAADLLAEAEHLFDQELLTVSAEAGPTMGPALRTARATLRRARETLPNRPATAAVLAGEVLRELDRLAAARLSSREAH